MLRPSYLSCRSARGPFWTPIGGPFCAPIDTACPHKVQVQRISGVPWRKAACFNQPGRNGVWPRADTAYRSKKGEASLAKGVFTSNIHQRSRTAGHARAHCSRKSGAVGGGAFRSRARFCGPGAPDGVGRAHNRNRSCPHRDWNGKLGLQFSSGSPSSRDELCPHDAHAVLSNPPAPYNPLKNRPDHAVNAGLITHRAP